MKGKLWIVSYISILLIAAIWFTVAYGKGTALPAPPVTTTKPVKPAPQPAPRPQPAINPNVEAQPRIDIAFCLDTTGSMSGLIEGAKQKIWSIVNTVAAAKPKPVLRIGLVAYRDRGDAYVTRVTDFTSDLDAMYSELRALTADGGGDEPEHVNRAMHDAVNQLQWSKNSTALKILYLVGDAPPHMDYQDGYEYRTIAKRAAGRGIIVNTIQCGQSASTQLVWQEIARMAEGKYAAIDQSGGMMAVNSPYDAELVRLSSELNRTYVAYGTAGEDKKKAQAENDADAGVRSPAAAAERAEAKSGGFYKNESWDLVDAVQSNTVDLRSLPPADLPAPLREKSVEEQTAFLKQQAEQRSQIQQQIQELSRKRDAHVESETKKLGKESKDAFDAQVLQTLKEQGKEKGIDIE